MSTPPLRSVACPTCEKVVVVVDRKVAPFCSERCQQIDLGRWLAEDYVVPVLHEDPAATPRDDDR